MTIGNDQLACGTSTTGTGTLTLAAPPTGINAADPYAAFSGSGFGTSTGVMVPYSIVEYTDNTYTLPKQSESGMGTLLLGASLAATTLARTTVISKVTSMDSQPATVSGQTSVPTAITIGTAANVVVWFGPISWLSPDALPFWATANVTGSDLLGSPPLQGALGSGSNYTLVDQQLTYQRVFIGTSGLIKSVNVFGQAAYVGVDNASTVFNRIFSGLYEVGSDGRPGKQLINFGTFTNTVASAMIMTASAAQSIKAGYYYLALGCRLSGGSGSCALRLATSVAPSPLGTAGSNVCGPVGRATVATQTTLADPATLTSFTAYTSTNASLEFVCAFRAT